MLLACFSRVPGQVIALKEGGNMLERETLSQLHGLDKKIKAMTFQQVCCKLQNLLNCGPDKKWQLKAHTERNEVHNRCVLGSPCFAPFHWDRQSLLGKKMKAEIQSVEAGGPSRSRSPPA
jgi:hypothetical protein